MEDGKGARLRTFKRGLAVFVVAASLVALITAPPEVASIRSRDLAARYAIPLNQAGLYPGRVPDDENAALLFPELEAAKQGCTVDLTSDLKLKSAEQRRVAVDRCQGFVVVASRFAKKKQYQPVREGVGRNMLTPDHAKVRQVALSLLNAADVLAADGHLGPAMELTEDAVAASNHLRDEPFLISFLIWCRLYEDIANRVGEHAGRLCADATTNKRLKNLFEDVHQPDCEKLMLFEAHCVAKDASQTCHLNTQIRLGTTDYEDGYRPTEADIPLGVRIEDIWVNWSRVSWGPFVIGKWGRLLERIRNAPKDIDNFDSAQKDYSQGIEHNPCPFGFETFLLPEFGGISKRIRAILAEQELVLRGFQAIAENRMPAVAGTKDPFSGRPYRFKTISGGWVIYSLGEDGYDDDGVAANRYSSSTHSDIVFTWDGKNASLKGR